MSDLHTMANALPALPMFGCVHFPDGELPEFLCRRCHPELALSYEQRRILDEIDRRRRADDQVRESKHTELRVTQQKLAAMERRGTSFGIDARIYESLKRKAARLESEIG